MHLRLACLSFIKEVEEQEMSLRKAQNYLSVMMIENELVRCHGNQSEAARRLGINRLTLRTLMTNHNELSKSES